MRRLTSLPSARAPQRIDAAALTAALRRLVEREGLKPRTLVHWGAHDPELAAAYHRSGATPHFATAAEIVQSAAGAGGTLVIGSCGRRGRPALRDALAHTSGLHALVMPPLDASATAAFDRGLFDRGLVRLRRAEGEPALYLRSALVADAAETGGNTGATVAMSTLGHNAGFANQLFQYAFLWLYGLRNNCAIETPTWIGETVYGLPAQPISRRRRGFKGDPWSVRDGALWTAPNPPVEVDFWGYFQNPPSVWRQHRALLRRLFTPLPPWRVPIERWLAQNCPPGRTLVAIHLRRGDYRRYAAEKPWFRLLPAAWYRRWLERVWPSLDNPVLFIATDEPESVVPEFTDYAPLVATSLATSLPEAPELADFEIMARAGVLAIANSSFSRMAALLAADTQRCFIPESEAADFRPYDPWAPDDFWRRFGAPTTTTPSPFGRWLSRRPWGNAN